MPAYTTFEFSFSRDDLHPQFVEAFYAALQVDGVTFDKVFAWGCGEDMALPEIIHWNQARLDDNFRLGDDDDISLNYRQILLKGTGFEECRVFIGNYSEYIVFFLIVPEHELDEGRASLAKINAMCRAVITAMPVCLIQTYGELDEPDTLIEVEKGAAPSFLHGGFVSPDIYTRCGLTQGVAVEGGYVFASPRAH
ncbi:hypothetical protein [Spongiibacter marinus]|uniref:hypothetical protein n=1 Tax=Spongiibacter marinus TaxID=354246 RepID=UPI0003FE83D5|nr:hypothetical protein [Spongiibacter marinus]